MSTAQKLIAATSGIAVGSVDPIGIDFDGTNDYLSRSSDLVGNADGKTFTFSAWFYVEDDTLSPAPIYISSDGTASNVGVEFFADSGTGSGVTGFLRAFNSSNTKIMQTASMSLEKNTWNHLVCSVDLLTTTGHFYVNDEDQGAFSQLTNDTIDFTKSVHEIGGEASVSTSLKGRLAGVYLDYTYRDLSVASNRRDFIDADGLYVTPPTSGIISVPMDDADDPGRNDGTGGDFTLNGVVAQSGRGPNQYNSAASTFDGSADYLSIASLTGASDNKFFLMSTYFKLDSSGGNYYILSGFESGVRQKMQVWIDGSGLLNIIIEQAGAGTDIVYWQSSTVFVANKYYSIQVAFDTETAANCIILVNGSEDVGTYLTGPVNANIEWTPTGGFYVGRAGSGFGPDYVDGEISDFYLTNEYIDLSSSNPFYDTETDKPKFLGSDGSEPTGSSPLIYLPLRADDPGRNDGTGGDFTVNSGPYTGARGPSEFWGESADFNGSDQYLHRTSGLASISDSRFTTVAFSFFNDSNSGSQSVFTGYDSSSNRTAILVNKNAAKLRFYLQSSSGQILAISDIGVSLNTSSWFNVLISDNRTTQTTRIYVNDTAYTPTPSPNTVADVTYGDASFGVGVNEYNGDYTNDGFFNGKIGFFYFTTEFIDFSSEANRLKFFDAFGYPVDLGSDGSTPTGTQPLIYINKGFHSGTNLGSGGNFTPQNSPTDGGYVKG